MTYNDVPEDKEILGSRFVYTMKQDKVENEKDMGGSHVDKFKRLDARLCVQGFTENLKICVQAPTVQMETTRIILGIIAIKNWSFSVIDIARAFLQALDLAREVYVLPPIGVENEKICLSGFSQGCMMSINLGLTSDQPFNCVVGFSGKIINQKNLKIRQKSATDILLIHGDLDQVVSPNFMLEAKDFFIRNNIEIETHLIKNCDHHIPIEASSIALNYILKKIK